MFGLSFVCIFVAATAAHALTPTPSPTPCSTPVCPGSVLPP